MFTINPLEYAAVAFAKKSKSLSQVPAVHVQLRIVVNDIASCLLDRKIEREASNVDELDIIVRINILQAPSSTSNLAGMQNFDLEEQKRSDKEFRHIAEELGECIGQ